MLVIKADEQQYAAAGFPALSVPFGLDENGQPKSVVFTGDYLSEPKLLAVGYAFEQALRVQAATDLKKQ